MNKPNLLTYNAQFFIDKEKGKPTAKIRFRVKWESNTVAFSLGYRVEIDKWSTDTQRCKINTTHGIKKMPASKINKKIEWYQSVCERIFAEFNLKNIIPTKEQFKNDFNEKARNIEKNIKSKVINQNEIKELNLVQDIFKDFIKEEKVVRQWTNNTIEKMEAVQKKLLNFKMDLKIEEFGESNLLGYQLFLQNKEFQNSTILKNFGYLKWFLRWADKKGYNLDPHYKFFKPRLKTTNGKIIFLTKEELQKLSDFSIPENKNYLERVRDIFLFQCFTGLRYSDVANLKKSDIKDDHIEVTTVKTLDNLIIELNDYSRNILEKYKDFEPESYRALPVITNQKMNDYLKELAKLAEIDEPIRRTYFKGNQRIDEILPKWAILSTHAGRRTFICNALALGIPPQVVMKWTGHSDYKSMKPYIDIADDTKYTAMKKFNMM